MLGGGTSGAEGSDTTEDLRKRPGFSGLSMLGLNWCDRRANDSRLFGGGRGASIGRNVNGTTYISDQQVVHANVLFVIDSVRKSMH